MSLGSNICALCKGRGHLFCVQGRTYEWFICPACEWRGARRQEQPAVVVVRSKGWVRHPQ